MAIDKLDMQSPDLVDVNIQKLAELFPNCVTETAEGKAVDFDLLKQELNHQVIEGNKERYRLEWPGKREAIVTANLPTTNTLRPVREDSVDFDNTENLYIEGDNLEVLKLLQESYLGKIKMIYIDPPYNTGKDFVYKDNFTEDKAEHEQESGQRDEYGQRLVANPETSGRYHSDWLTMMYPRLKLARNLLTDDGVIFISIDDNEVHNLRKVCDEVFGEGNFIAELVWERAYSPKNDAKFISNSHDYVLMYSKGIENFKIGRLERTEDANARYSNPDNDPRGVWKPSDMSVKTYSAENDYPITTPSKTIEYGLGQMVIVSHL
jgi:adenine-specific DNA-methyltransferase